MHAIVFRQLRPDTRRMPAPKIPAAQEGEGPVIREVAHMHVPVKRVKERLARRDGKINFMFAFPIPQTRGGVLRFGEPRLARVGLKFLWGSEE